jgi:hypothetical protein
MSPSLVDDCPQEFCCTICDELAVTPVSCLACQNNVFCKTCISDWLQKNSSCPSCVTPWSPNKLVLNRIIQGMIDNLLTACNKEGCDFTGKQHEVLAHQKKCVIIACTHRGCGLRIPKYKGVEHASKCGHRPVKCTCGVKVAQNKMDQHVTTDCKHRCPQKCGEILLDKNNKHIWEDCPNRKVECSHAHLGCKWEGKYCDLTNHTETCSYIELEHVLRGYDECIQLLRVQCNNFKSLSVTKRESEQEQKQEMEKLQYLLKIARGERSNDIQSLDGSVLQVGKSAQKLLFDGIAELFSKRKDSKDVKITNAGISAEGGCGSYVHGSKPLGPSGTYYWDLISDTGGKITAGIMSPDNPYLHYTESTFDLLSGDKLGIEVSVEQRKIRYYKKGHVVKTQPFDYNVNGWLPYFTMAESWVGISVDFSAVPMPPSKDLSVVFVLIILFVIWWLCSFLWRKLIG